MCLELFCRKPDSSPKTCLISNQLLRFFYLCYMQPQFGAAFLVFWFLQTSFINMVSTQHRYLGISGVPYGKKGPERSSLLQDNGMSLSSHFQVLGKNMKKHLRKWQNDVIQVVVVLCLDLTNTSQITFKNIRSLNRRASTFTTCATRFQYQCAPKVLRIQL